MSKPAASTGVSGCAVRFPESFLRVPLVLWMKVTVDVFFRADGPRRGVVPACRRCARKNHGQIAHLVSKHRDLFLNLQCSFRKLESYRRCEWM